MKAVDVVRALGPVDLKSIRRDPMLRWLIVYPVFIAVLVRWGTPALALWLARNYRFDLTPYYPLLMSLVLLMTPMLAGIVIGFILLDQRDDQTLAALAVTPLTLRGYFVYRTVTPVAVSFMVTLLVFSIAGLLSIGLIRLAAAALGSALLAPLYAASLAAFASNKVQGFALSKAFGLLFVPPVLAYFVQSPWQLLFGLDPLYWPAKFVWAVHSSESTAWLYLAAGFAFQAVLLRVLLRRLLRPIHRVALC